MPAGWTSTSRSVGSGGQPLTDPRGVNVVMWFQDDLTGLKVDLHHAGEPKGHLAHDAQDDRAVRLHPDLVDANVPEPRLVVARSGHHRDVERGHAPAGPFRRER